MTIYVDADACPGPIKSILYRAVERCGLDLVLVSGQPLAVPPHPRIRHELVPPGADAADNRIAECCTGGDIVITADVPLAARAVEKGAVGLDPRGELYTAETVGERLSMRNFMEEMRFAGMVEGGPRAHRNTDNQAFANALDKLLRGAR